MMSPIGMGRWGLGVRGAGRGGEGLRMGSVGLDVCMSHPSNIGVRVM